MNLDFLEIGTCNFKTLIQQATDKTVGISVEPIKYYLDSLPNKKNVIKLNYAISVDDKEHDVDIFYIPEYIIKEKKLSRKIKGSNRIGSLHPAIKLLLKDKKITSTDIVIEKIKSIPINNLLEQYNIESIKLLKIDTEGNDCFILSSLEKYLKTKSEIYYPEEIIFETNFLSPKFLVDEILEKYKKIGYEIVSRKLDTTMRRKHA